MDITSFLLGFTKGKNSGGSSDGGDSSTPSVCVTAKGEVAVTEDNTEITIEHGLGVVPDIIMIIVNPLPATGEAQFQSQLGFRQALVDRFGEGFEKFCGSLTAIGTAITLAGTNSIPIDASSAGFAGGIYGANALTFKVTSSTTFPIIAGKTVNWYAVAGLT